MRAAGGADNALAAWRADSLEADISKAEAAISLAAVISGHAAFQANPEGRLCLTVAVQLIICARIIPLTAAWIVGVAAGNAFGILNVGGVADFEAGAFVVATPSFRRTSRVTATTRVTAAARMTAAARVATAVVA
mmetsp:Transcript_8072/g.17446  ORF Transcript_8072/g.17446 Transcript_8072/m.17446 type:complete len:135 (+) Transcript_8072:830-1234(+)